MLNTIDLLRIRREQGVKAAKAFARDKGYSVRWDRAGNLYIRDLLWAGCEICGTTKVNEVGELIGHTEDECYK